MELNYQITYLESYIYIQLFGTFDLSKGKQIVREAVAEVKKHQLKRVLVDVTQVADYESNTRILERFQISTTIAEYLPSDTKVAFLNSSSQIMPDNFNENVVVNRGGQIIVTIDMNEALAYLGVDSSNET